MSERGADSLGLEHADLDVVAARWFHALANDRGAEAIETRRKFQRWLDANADHAEAFARTSAAWDELNEHAAAPEMMALRQAAIADSRAAGLARWRTSRAARRRWPTAIAASIVLVAVGAAGYDLLLGAAEQTYATAIGQRQSVTLADNSRVDIDADSEISIAFTPTQRIVHVLRGQAYFGVEKDPARPFIVESHDRRVIATGTEFDVERLENGVRVTLVQGHVVVRRADATGARDEALAPGDQLTDQAEGPPKLVHLSSILGATAWRQGKLLFDNEPLASAAATMNRYSHLQVTADASVADIHVGGAFNAGDTTSFVGAVKAYYPVEAVSEAPDKIRLVRRH